MVSRVPRRGYVAAWTALLLVLPGVAVADQVLDQAKKLLQEKQAKGALALLLPLEAQRAGEIEYDYLLGISALDAGDPQRAVFALERVLAVDPNYLQARAEIARAYFVLGERENARREFSTVRAQGPPEAARVTIDSYLAALAPQSTQLRAFVEAGVGYDTNINAATGASAIALPALGGAIGQLNPLGVKQAAGFLSAAAGASVSHPIAEEWSVLGAAGYAGKYNQHTSDFNSVTFDASAGARWARGANQVIALAQGQAFRLDNSAYRNSSGGTAQWLHNLSDTQQFTGFVQYAALRYPTQGIRNANRTIGGVAYSQAFLTRLSPAFYVTAYGGEEKELDPSFPQVGNKPLGVRVGGQLNLSGQVMLYTAVSYEHRTYNGPEPLFLTTRRDNQTDFRIGLSYVPAPLWTITPQFLYTDNESNIELYAYTRAVTAVTARRDF